MTRTRIPSRKQSPASYDQRVRHIVIESAALGISKSFYVYTPPDLPVGKRVPSLYLLRGHEREWVNPYEDAARDGNVIDVYERLRAAGTVGPLVLVFPGLSSDDNAIPSFLMNMRAPELATKHQGIGKGQFADYFYNELIPFVDAAFPTLNDRRRRGIAGFSLGGAMAAKAAAERPDLFATAGAYDGTFLYARDKGRTVKRADGVITNPMFDASFGAPRDFAAIAANNPANLVLRGDPDALAGVTWMVSFGPRSAEPWQANYYRGMHFIRCLGARGLANALVSPALPGGVHTWRVADQFMEQTLPLHYRVLAHANPDHSQQDQR